LIKAFEKMLPRLGVSLEKGDLELGNQFGPKEITNGKRGFLKKSIWMGGEKDLPVERGDRRKLKKTKAGGGGKPDEDRRAFASEKLRGSSGTLKQGGGKGLHRGGNRKERGHGRRCLYGVSRYISLQPRQRA